MDLEYYQAFIVAPEHEQDHWWYKLNEEYKDKIKFREYFKTLFFEGLAEYCSLFNLKYTTSFDPCWDSVVFIKTSKYPSLWSSKRMDKIHRAEIIRAWRTFNNYSWLRRRVFKDGVTQEENTRRQLDKYFNMQEYSKVFKLSNFDSIHDTWTNLFCKCTKEALHIGLTLEEVITYVCENTLDAFQNTLLRLEHRHVKRLQEKQSA